MAEIWHSEKQQSDEAQLESVGVKPKKKPSKDKNGRIIDEPSSKQY